MQRSPSSARSSLTPTVPPGGLGPLIPKLGGGRPVSPKHAALAVFFLAGLADWLILWEHTGFSLSLLVAAAAMAVVAFGQREWPVLACAAIAPGLVLIEVSALSVSLALCALALAALLADARGRRARSQDRRAFTIREASLAQYLSTHDITHSGPAALPEL